MALSQNDIQAIKDLLQRDPTEVELSIFDTMWSEHCSYKSSKRILKRLPVTGSEVALGIGEDAGIIKLAKVNGRQYCIAVSHESHNHPSQILPIEGAATGVGGCVRDVYCMGADVIGVLNSLHFGKNSNNPIVDEIAEKVVYGVSDYGNPLGVPVLGGETLYHESYNDNCLVNVAAIGLIDEADIIHSYTPERAKSEPYDVILFGKSTDATGYGGASFSSATLDSDNDEANLGAVQVHDPFLKRVLVEAIKTLVKEVKTAGVEIGFKDLGAGGISCATSEIAAGSGFGVEIDLDKVNVAFENLPPEVIACSETQERFCIVVPRHFSEKVLDIFNNQFEMPKLYPQSGAVVIGEVITEKTYRIWSKGNIVCELPVNAITTDVKADRYAEEREIKDAAETEPNISIDTVLKATKDMFNEKNNASKRYVYRFYDNAVRGDTIVYPGEADAVVIAPIEGDTTGVAVSMDSNLYGNVDPYTSGSYAVAESIRNVIAVGARPIALTDCLNYGNPEKPSVFFDFEQGVSGIRDAAQQLNPCLKEAVPIISGNVSFYNESKQGNAVVPSPVLMCIGKMEDYHKALTMQLTQPDDVLIAVGKRYAEFGGTQFSAYTQENTDVAPQVRYPEEMAQNKAVLECINAQLLSACHDISMGGLYGAVIDMVVGERGYNKCGVALNLSTDHALATWLFSENGGYVLSVSLENLPKVKALLEKHEAWYSVIGKTTQSDNISVAYDTHLQCDVSINEVVEKWSQYCV